LETVECSRDMRDHVARACSEPAAETLVFRAVDYNPARRCNTLWVTATSLYWALAKIEALGDVGSDYVVVSRDEYNARFSD
jgi:hypothetical protein